MSFFTELKRRNVLRVGAAYVVTAWLIIQVVETIFPAFGFGDAVVRIATIVLAIGLVPTLILAWAFELTPEGLKKDADVDHASPVSVQAGKRLDRVILVILALALGYFAFDKFVLDPARDAALQKQVAEQVEHARQEGRTEALVESYGDNSIAVLPFVNMSDDVANEYFSDGISEELLNLLAKIPDLRVIARTSSFAFKGKDITVREIAESLEVAHVLEGSVRKAGGRVRITAQLIEARSDTHLWSETYDRELNDIFAIQEEVAGAISGALRLEFAGAGESAALPTVYEAANPAAYDAFLLGRELLRRRGRGADTDDAIEQFKRALRLDGGYAPAHALLGIASAMSTPSRKEGRWLAIPHLDRARELDPDLPEVYGGYALLDIYENPESAVAHATKALQLNPNYYDALNWLAGSLLSLGRFEEAEDALKRLIAIDPMNPKGYHNHVSLLITSGRYDEARARAGEYFGHVPRSHNKSIAFWQGNIAEGISWYLKGLPGNFEQEMLESVYAFTWIGAYAEARRIDAFMTFVPDIASGRFNDAIDVARKNAELYPEWEMVVVSDLANTVYFAGEYDEALPLLQQFAELVPPGKWDYWEFHIAWSYNEMFMRLAHLSRMTGDEDGSHAAVQIVEEDLANLHALGLEFSWIYRAEAMLAAYENDPDAMIEALKRVLKHGYRDPMLFRDPIFDAARDDPRFIAVQQELDDLLNVEREKALQMMCFDNPNPSEWQPLPETCEGVEEQ
ncbi:MAG: tetratricopeptide repeat protein [Lysobacterales bacterium]